MHTITVYPLGNADTTRIELENGKQLLIDFANVRTANDDNDRRCDVASLLRDTLQRSERNYFDVVAYSHLDDDHVHGSSEFFWFDHAKKYQGDDRIRISEMWVPAAAIVETNLADDAAIIQAEARHRLIQGYGIRVFSRPDALQQWLLDHGTTLDERRHLISDAGKIIPGLTREHDNIELFAHSPFAHRQPDGALVDRNGNCLVVHATFVVQGVETRALFGADIEWEDLSVIVAITEAHGNGVRLDWDVVKLPHHCSYLSLSEDKGTSETTPHPAIARLYEEHGQSAGKAVASCEPIGTTDQVQPPHMQAAAYYKRACRGIDGEFAVTMEHPSRTAPAPLVIQIDQFKATLIKPNRGIGGAAVGSSASRAG